MQTDHTAAPLLHDPHPETDEHHLSWEQSARRLDVTCDPGWVQYRTERTMRIRCCCGLDTDWTDRDAALRLYKEHLAPQPTWQGG
ncbi:hypothetical protein ACF1BN_15895 [Streptomyces sp. NPDC014861]|uniref:hypothetical protein n=1 Tax=Streptomyces sp. NPDC014861 TaxID=3364923 RepID=UPI0036FF8CE1